MDCQSHVPGVTAASVQFSGMAATVATGVGEGLGVAAGGIGCGTFAGGTVHAASMIKIVGTVERSMRGIAITAPLWDGGCMAATKLPAAKKIRVDVALAEQGLAESRARAQALVLAGLVYAGEAKIVKPGQQVAGDAVLTVRGRDHPWVSRGGIKLAHALRHFGLDPDGAIAMDIGSSTGGFTDVLLSHGAQRVFAVDSGTNQLAWKLRQDSRVTVLEQTSARVLTPREIDTPCNWVVCDASFIGLAKVLEVPLRLAAPACQLVALIKPQFEVGRAEVGKGGVVRDPALHNRVCEEVRCWLEGLGWSVHGLTESPITGPEGNVEFLIAAVRGQADVTGIAT